MSVARQLRGIVGTMATWATAFAIVGVVGLIPLSVFGALPPFELKTFLRFAINSALRWGAGGAAMGLAFSTAVVLGARRRTLVTLSPRRFVAWGFVAGAIVPMGLATIYVLTGHSPIAINLKSGLVFAGICGIVGGALAAVSLRAARQAPTSYEEAAQVRAPII